MRDCFLDRVIVVNGLTSTNKDHKHEYVLFDDGSGVTVKTFNGEEHTHEINMGIILEEKEHSHFIHGR